MELISSSSTPIASTTQPFEFVYSRLIYREILINQARDKTPPPTIYYQLSVQHLPSDVDSIYINKYIRLTPSIQPPNPRARCPPKGTTCPYARRQPRHRVTPWSTISKTVGRTSIRRIPAETQTSDKAALTLRQRRPTFTSSTDSCPASREPRVAACRDPRARRGIRRSFHSRRRTNSTWRAICVVKRTRIGMLGSDQRRLVS